MSYQFKNPPPPAGCWYMGGSLHVYILRRPRWLTRVMCKWLLEWEWIDA